MVSKPPSYIFSYGALSSYSVICPFPTSVEWHGAVSQGRLECKTRGAGAHHFPLPRMRPSTLPVPYGCCVVVRDLVISDSSRCARPPRQDLTEPARLAAIPRSTRQGGVLRAAFRGFTNKQVARRPRRADTLPIPKEALDGCPRWATMMAAC